MKLRYRDIDSGPAIIKKFPPKLRPLALRIRDRAFVIRHRRDLIRLGEFFGTDKWGFHWYLQHYQRYFERLRLRKLNVLEVGVGGYDHPRRGGESLRMWKAYFPKAEIFGIDIYDKRFLEEKRIKIFQGNQTDESFLREVVSRTGGFDIVIDDGSHINQHVIRMFQILFPLLRNPGIYVVEDTQTSYWRGYGGSSEDLRAADTTLSYFTRLVDSLNYQEILREGYSPNELDRHIVAMYFYHNLIFIFKGDNTERRALTPQEEDYARGFKNADCPENPPKGDSEEQVQPDLTEK